MWIPSPGKQSYSLADSNARINIWHGAVRSGKTVAANLRWLTFIGNAIDQNVQGDLLMWGKTERTLKRNILDPISDFLGHRFYYNKGEAEAFIFGRKVHCVGANDERAEGKIRGGTYLGAYGDELTLTPESFLNMTLSRLSLPRAKLFGTTNADGPYHYLKKDFIDRSGELNLREYKFGLRDNPHLPGEYVAELEKEYVGLWKKRYIDGLWVQAAGAVYDMWTDANVCEKDPDKVTHWFADCDYGTSNPCTFSLKGAWQQDGKIHVHTFREYWYDGRDSGQKTDAQYVTDLIRFLGTYRTVLVYIDPSAASFIAACRANGINAAPGDNDVLGGIRYLSTLIGEQRYTVDPSCVETVQGYGSYVWDEKAQRRGEDKPLKENDHTCDRDRYGIFTLFGSQKRTVRKTTYL